MPSFDDFDGFFRYYISQHSRSETRWVHFAATHAGAAIAVAAAALRRPALLAVAPLATYGPAFASHWIFEKNSPVTLKANPLWAVRADLRMVTTMWRGGNDELGRLAREELERRADVDLQGIRVHLPADTAAASAS